MSNPTTPFGWQMPTATDLVTDLPADFEVFGQAVATSMADLLGGTTGQILSKTSNTDMDFTWTTPNPGDITGVTAGVGISGGGTSGDVTVTNSMATAMTTSGDLIQATGSGTFARLATGTNGQYLTTNGTTNSWATISAGALTLLSTTALSGTSTTVSSISGAYKNLQIVVRGVTYSASSRLCISANGTSTGTSYSDAQSGSFGYSTVGALHNDNVNTDVQAVLNLTNYSSSSYWKPGSFTFFYSSGNGSSSGGWQLESTSAITSITVTTTGGSATFNAGQILIYGVN